MSNDQKFLKVHAQCWYYYKKVLWPQNSALFYYVLKCSIVQLSNLHSVATLVAQSQRCARPWCIHFRYFIYYFLKSQVGNKIGSVKLTWKISSATLLQLYKKSRSWEAILLLIVVLNPQCAIQFEFCIILLLTNVFTTLVGKWKFKIHECIWKVCQIRLL